MKPRQIIIIAVFALVATTLYYSFSGGESTEAYREKILKDRQEKDLFMKNDAGSPFVVDSVPFQPLKYFEPDIKYRIQANFVTASQKKIVMLPTSDGQEKKYAEYGYAEFSLEGEPCRLLILEVIDPGPYRGTLFLAFADATSAAETYGAGRYLEVKKTLGASQITLDFNEAYNPYCAYADSFSCPFPPKENILKVAIRAGEKNFH